MQSKKREALKGIVFARAYCCLGIVIFHYFCHSKRILTVFFRTSNIDWGFIYVTSFFAISGIVLYYNYPKNISLKKFYYKRWKSIFPAYYISFIYFYHKNIFLRRKIFYNGSWTKLFFTLFGMDGYLCNFFKIKTYYIMGEWFTGAILLFL